MLKVLQETSKIDSELFYWRMRPYFADWAMVTPLGVQYLGTEQKHRTHFGISAAQSSLFQAFDIIFGISHLGDPGGYLQKIRSHMPEKHRRFLENLTTYANEELLSFVQADAQRYIKNFRRGHMSLANRYAVVEAFKPNKVAFGLN